MIFGIDEIDRIAFGPPGIEIDHRDALGHADLDRREADAARVLHGIEHVVHEALERAVDLRHGLGHQLQPRIGRLDELEYGHGGRT